MPDFNGTPLFIGAPVIVVAPSELDPNHLYDHQKGEIVFLPPCASPLSGVLAEVKFENRLIPPALFYPWELLICKEERRKDED